MARQTRGLPERKPLTSRLDKWLFLVIFILGAAGIIYLKEFVEVEPLYVPLWPCGLMIFYLFYVLATQRFRLREDIAADNFYYLGFLFTLISLSHAIYVSQGEEGIEHIVADFGIALWTTILGVFLRIFINQFRQDPVEIEREARLELAEAASRLRGSLDFVVIDMNDFRRRLQQSSEEAIDAITKKAGEDISEATTHYGEVAEAVLKHIEEIHQAHAGNTERLDAVADRTVAAFEGVLVRIEKIEAPEDILSRKLMPVVTEIERVAAVTRERVEAEATEFKELRLLIRQASSAVGNLDQRLRGVSGLIDELERFGERVGAVRVNLDKSFPPLAEALKVHEEVLEKMQQATEQRAKESTESFTRALKQQEDLLKDFAEQVNRRASEILDPLTDGARSGAEALRDIDGLVAEAAEAIKRHNAELEAELSRSRAVTIQVQDGLISMVNTLSERLGDTTYSSGRTET